MYTPVHLWQGCGMGASLLSVNEMVSYAGDLRRSARHEPAPDVARKIRQAANDMEKTAFARLSLTSATIGKLLDTLA